MQTVIYQAASIRGPQKTKEPVAPWRCMNFSTSIMCHQRKQEWNSPITRWIVLWVTLILLLTSAGPAFAGAGAGNPTGPSASAAPANATPNASLTTNQIPTSYSIPNTNNLLSVVGSVSVAGVQMANRFIPYAEGMALLLGAIGIVWTGIIVLLSQADIWGNVLKPMFITAITTGFAMFMLIDYSVFAPLVVDGFIDAGQILVGVPSGQNHSELSSMLGMTSTTSLEILKNMAAQFDFANYPSTWAAIEAIPGMIANFVLDVLTAIPMYAIFLVEYVIFLIVYLAFQFAIGVAIAVGPVFIPFLVLPITRSLFDGWFKMLIVSGLYMMTSTVIVGLLFSMSIAMSSDLSLNMNTASGVADHFGQLLLLIVFGLFSIIALFMTHSFAHSIAGNVNLGGLNVAGTAAKKAAGAVL